MILDFHDGQVPSAICIKMQITLSMLKTSKQGSCILLGALPHIPSTKSPPCMVTYQICLKPKRPLYTYEYCEALVVSAEKGRQGLGTHLLFKMEETQPVDRSVCHSLKTCNVSVAKQHQKTLNAKSTSAKLEANSVCIGGMHKSFFKFSL